MVAFCLMFILRARILLDKLPLPPKKTLLCSLQFLLKAISHPFALSLRTRVGTARQPICLAFHLSYIWKALKNSPPLFRRLAVTKLKNSWLKPVHFQIPLIPYKPPHSGKDAKHRDISREQGKVFKALLILPQNCCCILCVRKRTTMESSRSKSPYLLFPSNMFFGSCAH